jgi:hypothetical protein
MVCLYCNMFHCEASDHPVVCDMQIVDARNQFSPTHKHAQNNDLEEAKWYVVHSTQYRNCKRPSVENAEIPL